LTAKGKVRLLEIGASLPTNKENTEKMPREQAIAKRKKAEESLRDSELRFRSVYENSFDAILLTKPDGQILSANPAAQRMFGMTEEEIQKAGRNGIIVIDERVAPALRERARTGKVKAEFTFRRKDGSTFEGEAASSVFTDSDGIVITSMIIRDITERKKAEDNFAKKQEELQTIIDSSQGLIFYKDRENNFVQVNKAFAEIMGLPKEQINGRSIFDLYPKEEAEAFWSDDKQVIKSGKAKVGIVEKMQSKKGKRWVQTDKIPYRDTEGNIIGVIGFSVDITDRKKAEEELDQYRMHLEKLVEERTKQLKDSERLAAIGATAGMVGHDIRNPLQAITSDVFLVKTELASISDSEEKKNVLESMVEIEKNIDYINKIVQDLQDFARPLNPKIEESDLKTIVKTLTTKNGLPKNIKVSVEISDEASKVKADSYYLNRILYNLVTNAVQAMPNGGKLTIAAHKEANDTVLSIIDTGVGIPKEIHDKMFTLMFTTKSKGQGFGLPVVKRMTETLGGTVTFESQAGNGTTFTVRLPPKKLNVKWHFKQKNMNP